MNRLLASLFAILLSGCASLEKGLPDGYRGPSAFIEDFGEQESGSRGQFFVLIEFNGRAYRNSIHETRQSSAGKGFSLAATFIGREIPAIRGRAKVLATHQTAAPIHEIAARAAGTFFSVEAELDFTPEQGGLYRVRGELTRAKSCVWIEDFKTKMPATAVHCTS